jgi:hypothetical protein
LILASNDGPQGKQLFHSPFSPATPWPNMEAARETWKKPGENLDDGHKQSLNNLNSSQLASRSPTLHKVQFASFEGKEEDLDDGSEEPSHRLLTPRQRGQVSLKLLKF